MHKENHNHNPSNLFQHVSSHVQVETDFKQSKCHTELGTQGLSIQWESRGCTLL